MPVVISKRVLFTFAGVVVLLTFHYGTQSYDYSFDPGRGISTEDQALYRLEKSGFLTQTYAVFLAEVDLGNEPNDTEIHAV